MAPKKTPSKEGYVCIGWRGAKSLRCQELAEEQAKGNEEKNFFRGILRIDIYKAKLLQP